MSSWIQLPVREASFFPLGGIYWAPNRFPETIKALLQAARPHSLPYGAVKGESAKGRNVGQDGKAEPSCTTCKEKVFQQPGTGATNVGGGGC